jgi:hypothetical protein
MTLQVGRETHAEILFDSLVDGNEDVYEYGPALMIAVCAIRVARVVLKWKLDIAFARSPQPARPPVREGHRSAASSIDVTVLGTEFLEAVTDLETT